MAVMPDGKRVVSASRDRTLKLWDLESGDPQVIFHADAALTCCAFATPKTIVAGDMGGHLHFLALEE